MTDPQQTISYLDELQQLGFTNDAFWRIHHFCDKEKRDTINTHKAYCEKTGAFREGDNNARVQERLGLLLKYYKAYHSGNPRIFPDLADAVCRLIPSQPF
jgi:hypothetical protein